MSENVPYLKKNGRKSGVSSSSLCKFIRKAPWSGVVPNKILQRRTSLCQQPKNFIKAAFTRKCHAKEAGS